MSFWAGLVDSALRKNLSQIRRREGKFQIKGVAHNSEINLQVKDLSHLSQRLKIQNLHKEESLHWVRARDQNRRLAN